MHLPHLSKSPQFVAGNNKSDVSKRKQSFVLLFLSHATNLLSTDYEEWSAYLADCHAYNAKYLLFLSVGSFTDVHFPVEKTEFDTLHSFKTHIIHFITGI